MSGENDLLSRLPPHNREAERSVIGSMLRNNDCINDVVRIVHKEDFYLDAHQKLYDTIVQLNAKSGQPVDLVLLAEALLQGGLLEDVGGYGYLSELWDAAPNAANASYYAHIIHDKGMIRSLIRSSNDILTDAYEQAMPVQDMIASAEKKILEVSQRGLTDNLKTLAEAIDAAYNQIDERMTGSAENFRGLSTGYRDLNELTAGLHKRELVIIAARPSVGKTAFSLGMVRNIITQDKVGVFFVSLEQSHIELAERLLCSQARVDGQRLRQGSLTAEDMERLVEAGAILRDAPLFIDDTPQQTMLRIAANARRLKRQKDIQLVVVDYLQLIEPENRRDPRHEQVAQISRRLKFLARELHLPVIALAQVNRAAEDRQDHRPRLSDLRESGCLTGDTLITMAETGSRVPIRELVGRSGFQVWALDEASLKLTPAVVSHAFSTGRKPVFRLETRLGRVIRATANHPFRSLRGWKRLDEFRVGDRLALPRRFPSGVAEKMQVPELALLGHLIGDGCTLPRHAIQYTTKDEDLAEVVASLAKEVFGKQVEPRIKREQQWFQVYLAATEHLARNRRNPVAAWLDSLGVFGLRSWEKRIPGLVFEQNENRVGVLLRHLWATDGCIRAPSGKTRHPACYYASSSEGLARDVQALLLRVGINAVLRARDQKAKGRMQFHVLVMGRPDILRYAEVVGAVGTRKRGGLEACHQWELVRKGNTNRDIIPSECWRSTIIPLMQNQGLSLRKFQTGLGMAQMGTGLYSQNLSRDRMRRVAKVLTDPPELLALAESDLYWDEIRAIEPAGEEEVFDLTVPGPHNFVANDILVHNSIEQDADCVMMLHRPDRYEPGQREGIIEVIIAKNRQGPVGEVTLAYVKQYLLYEDYEVGTPFTG